MATEAPQLTQGEQDFLGQLCGFAKARAQNGVYMTFNIERATGMPVLAVVAFGEQAMALQQIVLGAQVPQSPLIEVVSSLEDARL